MGCDLSQLLGGDIQIGRQDATDLPERAEACVAAYADGLADEGVEMPLEQVRRGHAVCLMLFNGLPSLPAEASAASTMDESAFDHWTRQRAGIARYALDVLARTEPVGG